MGEADEDSKDPDPCDIILKICRVKSAMNKMEQAKINAERARLGLPPVRKWYENCCSSIFSSIRLCFCRVFCPCCNSKCGLCKRLCAEGRPANIICKSMIGFLTGVVLSLMWFSLMVYQLEYSMMTSTVTCAILGAILSVGLGFSVWLRSIVLLIVPSLFSSRGRVVLLTYAFMLVMAHPMKNFEGNIEGMSETLTCGQQMSYNATKEIVDTATAPVKSIIEDIRGVIISMMELAETLRDAFLKVKNLFKEVLSAIRKVQVWLKSMLNKCNENMGAPYKKCMKAFKDGEADCRSKLGIFEGICGIVNVASKICHVARVGELLCKITAAIKSFIVDKVKTKLTLAVQNVYEMFYFNVTLVYKYDMKMEQSKSFEQIRRDITGEIRQKLKPLLIISSGSQFVAIFLFAWVLFQAVMYRRKYLRRDDFDNYYITETVEKVDERREEMQKETILPLNWSEGKKYISTRSIRLAKSEKLKLITGLVIWGGTLLHASFYLGCDYGLYWLLGMLRHHGELQLHQNYPNRLKIHVQGKGILADIYRVLVTTFDPLDKDQLAVDTTDCLPKPIKPNFYIYKVIASIFGVCLLLVLLEAYGLRLRHVIMGSYYPRRRKERAVWLYNHILQRRGGLLKFLRRQMRKDYQTEEKQKEKEDAMSRFQAMIPCCGKLLRMLGFKRKHCLCCGRIGETEDMENFVHCRSRDCKAVYCRDCFTDINNLCTVCMSPVEYGDFSDFSEERDSSDEDIEAGKPDGTTAERLLYMMKKKGLYTSNVNKNANLGLPFAGSRTTPPLVTVDILDDEITSDDETDNSSDIDNSEDSRTNLLADHF